MLFFDKDRPFSTMKIENTRVGRFQSAPLPSQSRLAGLAALVNTLNVSAPVRIPACVSDSHISGSIRTEERWRVYDKRYWPGDTFDDHLDFALRNENLDLLVLKRTFQSIEPKVMQAFVKATPTGIPARRAWYLYELMTGRALDIADDPGIPAIDLLSFDNYFTGKPRLSRRHRVRDNLLGNGAFCPIIRRTKKLCYWPTAALVLKSRESGLPATGWSAGAKLYCKPEKTNSPSMKSSGCRTS